MSNSRQRILDRLRANFIDSNLTITPYTKPLGLNCEQLITRFTEQMQSVRGEVHRIGRNDWIDWLNRELPTRGLNHILVGNGQMGAQFAEQAADTIQVHQYQQPIETWKQTLFTDIDAAITGTYAGLAESGSLVLWPDTTEPRLMSLVPPVHIALLDVEHLMDNFAELIGKVNWTSGIPTNLLLITGPSKSADIEQTLAYGVHGPKELITLLLE